ncbi:MAG: FAD-binding protein, partial [Deltaproteobacteria bacterium]|nr:FAD-binding protein [Deltaproteobacteria bacterium]
IFEVKCVILATGGYSQIYYNSSNTPGINGDGLALAYDVGVPMKDMEFVQFYPTAAGKRGNNLVLYEGFLFKGALLKNADNENVLAKHGLTDPKTITRDLLAQTIFKEIMAGFAREHGLLMDLSGVSDELLTKLKPMLPKSASERKECIVSPTTHHTMGGILIDSGTRTNVPGLFAVGEVCGGMHGANRLAGNALAEIFAMGGIAGSNGARYASDIEMGGAPEDRIENERTRLESLFSQKGEDSQSLITSLKMMMLQKAGIVRNPDDLEKALTKIEDIRSKSRNCIIATPKDLMHNLGLQNMLLIAEMVCKAALLRKESRGSHWRPDYPQEDNVNWLKNIVIHKENDEMMLDVHPVQMEFVSPS